MHILSCRGGSRPDARARGIAVRPHGGLRALPGVLAMALVGGCAREPAAPDARSLSHRFRVVNEFNVPIRTGDLDGDGEDEIIAFYTFNAPPRVPSEPRHDAVILRRRGGEAIDQLNYIGTVLPPHALDVDGDGEPEVLVPFLRADSLYLSIATNAGAKRSVLLLGVSRSKADIDSPQPWRPDIRGLFADDVDGDGAIEIVTVVDGGSLPGLQRSVLVHDPATGRLEGRSTVGAALISPVLADFDGDGHPELITGSTTPLNGARAGGLDDRHSYLVGFRLWPTVGVAWSREMAGAGSITDIVYDDVDQDGRPDLLALTTPDNAGSSGRLEWIDPATRRTVRRRAWPDRLFAIVTASVTAEHRSIVLLNRSATGRPELWLLDASLSIVRRYPVPAADAYTIGALPDLDGDGTDEIILLTPAGYLVLGRDLRVKAAFAGADRPGPAWLPAAVSRGAGLTPDVLATQGAGYALLHLEANPRAWFWRWGRWVATGAGALLLLALLVRLVLEARRIRILRAVHGLVVDAAAGPLMLIRRDGMVQWSNATMRRWLGLAPAAKVAGTHLEKALESAPELRQFCTEVLAFEPPRHRQTEGSCRMAGEARDVCISAEPVSSAGNGVTHFLVQLEDRAVEVELREARAWSLVAQRVAHDFRKPLSGIVQELHRLQANYRRGASATTLDGYAQDIEKRVLGLRTRADELLQVLGGEQPRLVEADLNDFVRGSIAELRCRLPSDVQLDVHLADDAPLVRLDPRLMDSVVANLVANSIEAMPSGGTITLSTNLVRSAGLRPEGPPCDYGRLEVLDDGEGLTDEVRRRLFEPGFTTRENGWGLGLAATRRIVENHGGSIEVQGEPGRGAAFILYLPAVRIAALDGGAHR